MLPDQIGDDHCSVRGKRDCNDHSGETCPRISSHFASRRLVTNLWALCEESSHLYPHRLQQQHSLLRIDANAGQVHLSRIQVIERGTAQIGSDQYESTALDALECSTRKIGAL